MTQTTKEALRGLTALLLAAWALGCPSSQLPDPEDASTPPSDAYVAPPLPEGWEIFEAYVARTTRHCESCALGLDPEIERTIDAVRAGRIGIDAARMSECLRTARLGGHGYALRDWTLAAHEECPGALVPRTPLGAPCDTATECVDGFCQRDDYSRSRPTYTAIGCGVCVPRRGEGGPCEGHGWEGADVECAAGLRCSRETATCVRREVASLGEACLGVVACAPGLRCASGVCVDRLCDGAPCGRSYGSLCTEPDACEPSLDCNDGVCARTATPGERCAPPDVCGAGAECVDGVCVRFPGLGESCRDRCARGLCSGGRCVTLAEGEACEVSAFLDACADGLICDGTCIRRPQLGEACSFEPATCELGAVCNMENVCEALCRLGPEP